jgi:hypothetical protein
MVCGSVPGSVVGVGLGVGEGVGDRVGVGVGVGEGETFTVWVGDGGAALVLAALEPQPTTVNARAAAQRAVQRLLRRTRFTA